MKFQPSNELRYIVAACAKMSNHGAATSVPFSLGGYIWGMHPKGHCFCYFKAPAGETIPEGYIFTGSALDGSPSPADLFLVTETFEILPVHPRTDHPLDDFRQRISPPIEGEPIPPFNPVLLQLFTEVLRMRYSIPIVARENILCSLVSSGPKGPIHVISYTNDLPAFIGGILPVDISGLTGPNFPFR